MYPIVVCSLILEILSLIFKNSCSLLLFRGNLFLFHGSEPSHRAPSLPFLLFSLLPLGTILGLLVLVLLFKAVALPRASIGYPFVFMDKSQAG